MMTHRDYPKKSCTNSAFQARLYEFLLDLSITQDLLNDIEDSRQGLQTMKSACLDGTLKLLDVPLPVRWPGTSLVKVNLAGICNTDLEITKMATWTTMEFSATSFWGRLSSAIPAILSGKRVTTEINIPVRPAISANRAFKHCRNIKTVGISGLPGVFAEYAVLPDENLHVIPESVSSLKAVFTEPLAAAAQVFESGRTLTDQRVCLIGDGKLGLLISMVLSGKED